MSQPTPPDPDNPTNAVLYLRAEGTLGLIRSSLTVAGCILAVVAVIAGSISAWWLIAVIPLGLFNLIEVIGSIRYRRLTRR